MCWGRQCFGTVEDGMETTSGWVRESLYRRGHVQEAREFEPGWLEPVVVVETQLEGCVQGMYEGEVR